MFGEDGQENVPHKEWLVDLEQVAEEFRQSLKQQGREDEFVGIKVHIPFTLQTEVNILMERFLLGYIYLYSTCYSGGTRMVHGGLYTTETTVPALDRR